MKNLQLSLKKEWFDLTNPEGKTEDYREITPYWCNRFLLFNGHSMPAKWWGYVRNYEGCSFIKSIKSDTTFKPFENNIMTLGYPKKGDLSRIKTFKHAGIEIREGREDCGAETGVKYFVIKHGEKI